MNAPDGTVSGESAVIPSSAWFNAADIEENDIEIKKIKIDQSNNKLKPKKQKNLFKFIENEKLTKINKILQGISIDTITPVKTLTILEEILKIND